MFFKLDELPEYVAEEPFTRYAKPIFDNVTIPGAPLSMGVFRYLPGQKGPRHKHDYEVEVYLCTGGKGIVTIENTIYELVPGTVLYIPPQHYHETRNHGEEDFTFLAIFSPPVDFQNVRNWQVNS
jgi:quercetin dioxygenase-like cupin family protein